MVDKPRQDQNKLQVPQGDRVSTSNSGRHEYTTMQNIPHIYNNPPRPTMPQFLENPTTRPIILAELEDSFGAYIEEYRELGDCFHLSMTFSFFYNMKSKNIPREFNRAFN